MTAPNKSKVAVLKVSEIFAKFKQSGLEERPGQIAMAEKVEQAISNHQFAVLEGGTGIGKTFAYLAPAVMQSQHSNKTIVIATATVALQNQLIDHDLPALEKLLQVRLKYGLAKGRRRYLCPQRMYQAASDAEQQQMQLAGLELAKFSATQQQQLQQLTDAYESNHWHGDGDQLEISVDSRLWQQVTTDNSGCLNRKCDFFNECPYFKSKRELRKVNIIVTNHDLLLSDIELGSGVVLPEAKNCLYFIDEAHHFPTKAVNHFTSHVELAWAEQALERLYKVTGPLAKTLLLPTEQTQAMQVEHDQIAKLLAEAKQICQQLWQDGSENVLLTDIPESLQATARELVGYSNQLTARLRAMRECLIDQHSDQTMDNFDTLLAHLGAQLSYLSRFQQTWQIFITNNSPTIPPIARWLSQNQTNNNIQVNAAMTSAANFLPSYFWDLCDNAVILCSATLRRLANFDYFTTSCGLQYYPERLVTAHFDSPFAYDQSTLQCVDIGLIPNQQNQEQFISRLSCCLPELLQQEQGGSLVLFTNRHVMHEVCQKLDHQWAVKVLMQGNKNRQQLLACHRKRIDRGETSVLFGLQSLAEGIDLPGDYCRHVIITKLPFAVPSTPIEQVIASWWQQQGQSSFQQQSLPHAALKLTQYVGRLIRQQQDRGLISILDYRLVSKTYGKQLLASMPAFTRRNICYNSISS